MLRIAEQLEVTFDTAGWKTVIKPLLDKMIKDCIGFRNKEGNWIAGAMQRENISSDTAKVYSQALIEFESNLMDHIAVAKSIKDSITKKVTKKDKYLMPMADTRYAV